MEQIDVGEDLPDAFARGVEPGRKLRAHQAGITRVTDLLRILVKHDSVDLAEGAGLKLLAGEPFNALLHSAQLAKSLGCAFQAVVQMRERLFGERVHVGQGRANTNEWISEHGGVRASDAAKRIQQCCPVCIEADAPLPVGKLDIFQPANVLACEIIEQPSSAFTRRKRSEFLRRALLHFAIVRNEIGMIRQHLADDTKRLFPAHSLVTLRGFGLQRVQHIHVRCRILACKNAEQSRTDFAEQLCCQCTHLRRAYNADPN